MIAGTFVVVSGLAYLAFMAAWLNVFQLIGVAQPAQITLGLLATTIGLSNVKDFAAFHRGISLSIPESAKPGIYARAGTDDGFSARLAELAAAAEVARQHKATILLIAACHRTD